MSIGLSRIFFLHFTFILHHVQKKTLTNNPVAVFDSGIGSLSIIRELKREIPYEDLLYFADRVHFPYGTKPHAELREIIVNTINYLKRYKPKLVVVASNTPSVQVLDEVRRTITDISIIGVRPPLKEAARLTKKKHIGIMATEGMIRSREFENQIRREVPQHILVTRFLAFYRMAKKSGRSNLRILVSDGKREFEKSVRALGVKEPIEEVFLTF